MKLEEELDSLRILKDNLNPIKQSLNEKLELERTLVNLKTGFKKR